MKRVFARRPSAALVVAMTALVVSLAGTAMAAQTLVSGDSLIKPDSLSGNRVRQHTLTGTQINLKRLGTVPSAVHASRATTANNATTANSAGSANNANALGGQTAASYEGRIQWVHVRADGTVLAQTGGISVYRPQTGSYFVSFPIPVLRDALDATLHFDYLVSQNGEIDAAVCGASKSSDMIDPVTGQVPCFLGASNSPSDVQVETTNDAGSPHDQGFYLAATP
jgi:hypothetical protein